MSGTILYRLSIYRSTIKHDVELNTATSLVKLRPGFELIKDGHTCISGLIWRKVTGRYREWTVNGKFCKSSSEDDIRSQMISSQGVGLNCQNHDDLIKWKHFPRHWHFLRGIQRSPVVSLTKASDADFWFFLWAAPEQTIEQTIKSQALWRHCNVSQLQPWMAYMLCSGKSRTIFSWKISQKLQSTLSKLVSIVKYKLYLVNV